MRPAFRRGVSTCDSRVVPANGRRAIGAGYERCGMNDESVMGAILAEATAAQAVDRIFLRDHEREIEIGAYAEEYGVRQRVRFSVTLEVPLFPREAADDVSSIVSYDLIVGAIDAVANGPRIQLLETFGVRLAEELFLDPRIFAAHIRIEKLDRVSGALGIELSRRRAT